MRDFAVFAVAYALALLGVAGICYALFVDRSRGRRRCPKCWYSMAGAPSRSCSECGHTVQKESRFYRTRRRWKLFFGAVIIVLIALGLSREPFYRAHGYDGLIPASALLVLVQFNDSFWIVSGINHHCSHDMWHRSIEDRFIPEGRTSALWRWQWRWLGRTALRKIDSEVGRGPQRWAYYSWLGWSRDGSGDPQLRERITTRLLAGLDDPDPDNRRLAAIQLFDPLRVEETASRTGSLLDHPDSEIRRGAVAGIGMAAENNDEALHLLIDAFDSEYADVRAGIFSFLLYTEREELPSGFERIRDSAIHDSDCNVRLNAIVADVRFAESDDRAWEIIKGALSHHDRCIRRGGFHAIDTWYRSGWSALGRVQPPESVVPILIRGLSDDDETVRHHLSRVIPLLGIPDSELREHADELDELATSSDDWYVRDAAQSLMSRLE